MSNEIQPMTQDNMMQPMSKRTYCSVKGDDRATLAKVFNAANNPEFKVADFINKTIMVKDVLIEDIEIVDEETGEVSNASRVVLIDDKGKAYQAVSSGLYGAIKRMVAIFGEPTWDEPIPMTIKQVAVKNGSMLTVDVAM